MNEQHIHALAARLVTARQTLTPIEPPKDMTKAEAVAVKHRSLQLVTAGNPALIRGYKVSMSMTWGALTDDMIIQGPASLHRDRLFDPLVETEVVFCLDDALDPTATLEELLGQSHVCAGIEIADSRWAGWQPSASEQNARGIPNRTQIEADNALSGMLVLGGPWIAAHTLGDFDLNMAAWHEGRRLAEGSLTHIMNHPGNAVLWLARELANSGLFLESGTLVSTGNPYRDLITVPKHGGLFEARLAGVGSAFVTFV
ncbi:hypothetical protein N5D52_25075 [Pseudomonas sp. GD03860]|uniref:2-keto-4-pentenoate hydratase n=1 Tax=Pseudomonas TaxID=286 RepID=UPI00236396C1|nr:MULTISPECIES: hypothetical protein [Pseudomonas]MDD2058394.1 hypothetical protein [Pseudomonas putida]MDH0640206.1 hypothetical protein [Pseudomonas sp. GD03860]